MNETCGFHGYYEGLPMGPVSGCVRKPGHDQYHEDRSGSPFGPWQGGDQASVGHEREKADTGDA